MDVINVRNFVEIRNIKPDVIAMVGQQRYPIMKYRQPKRSYQCCSLVNGPHINGFDGSTADPQSYIYLSPCLLLGVALSFCPRYGKNGSFGQNWINHLNGS